MREPYELLTRSQVFPRAEISDRSMRFSPVLWLNLVCLDAPIVAVTWQWLFARSFHVSLPVSTRAALFLTAWLIYLADRLADTCSLKPLSLRQQFCQRYQSTWLFAIVVLAIIDLWIIPRQLDRATIYVGILLGALSLVYLAMNYWLGRIWRIVPIKEVCVGSLFATGTVAALFPRTDFTAGFAASFFLFAALCSSNCIGIAVWERDLDRAQRKNSIATRWSRTQLWFQLCMIGLAVTAIAMALITKAFAQLYCCIGLSALLLGALDWAGDKILRDGRTAMADLVLLTPALLFPLGMLLA
jgi:hypothetical protein